MGIFLIHIVTRLWLIDIISIISNVILLEKCGNWGFRRQTYHSASLKQSLKEYVAAVHEGERYPSPMY